MKEIKIKIDQFIKQAIKNGYDENRTNGWDWIRDNLKDLDFIFQLAEYKNQKGMKYKCMPLLLQKKELTELEKGVLETAWYCNNERIDKKKEKEKIEKLNNDGFFNLENDEKLNKKKCEFIVDTSSDIFGGLNKEIGKLLWSPVDKRLMAMKQKHRRRGIWVDAKNVYVKII